MRRLPEKAWENLFWQLLSMQIHILTGERQAQLKEKHKKFQLGVLLKILIWK